MSSPADPGVARPSSAEALPDRPARRVAVIGAGLAGVRTAASLRDAGFRGEITMLGAEGLAPYDRPPLSKDLLTRTEPAWLATELGCDAHALADRVELAAPARGLGPASNGVRIDLDEGTLEVDVAVLATGAHAWRPVDWAGAVVLHTAADAAVLRRALTPGTRLVCVGAGWIGAEVSGVAAATGCEVTVLEGGPAPLARPLGAEVGDLVVPWYAECGVDLHVGARVTSVHPDAVHLADGRRFDADVVLAAVGSRPTTAWLGSAVTLTTRGAVAVDSIGRADGARAGFAPGALWAVGDCADRRTARDGLVAGGHWASALHDPTLVARGIMGGPLPAADPAPHAFSTHLGHEVALVGRVRPGVRVAVRGDPRDGPWTALYLAPGQGLRPGEAVLTAGFAVDSPRDVGALRRMLGRANLPVVDVAAATMPDRALRDAVRG